MSRPFLVLIRQLVSVVDLLRNVRVQKERAPVPLAQSRQTKRMLVLESQRFLDPTRPLATVVEVPISALATRELAPVLPAQSLRTKRA